MFGLLFLYAAGLWFLVINGNINHTPILNSSYNIETGSTLITHRVNKSFLIQSQWTPFSNPKGFHMQVYKSIPYINPDGPVLVKNVATLEGATTTYYNEKNSTDFKTRWLACDKDLLELNSKHYEDSVAFQNCTNTLITERVNIANLLSINVGLRYEIVELTEMVNDAWSGKYNENPENCYEKCNRLYNRRNREGDCTPLEICEQYRDGCIERCQAVPQKLSRRRDGTIRVHL